MHPNYVPKAFALLSFLTTLSLQVTSSGKDVLVPEDWQYIGTALSSLKDQPGPHALFIAPGIHLEPVARFAPEQRTRLRRAPGQGRVILTSARPPANDRLASPRELVGPSVREEASNYAATASEDEPAYLGSREFHHSLWWSWVAPRDGKARFRAESHYSDFGVLVDVYHSGPTVGLSRVEPLSDQERVSDDGASYLVTGGEHYLLRMSSATTNAGNATIWIQMYEPPPNDSFTNAVSILGDFERFSGDNDAATGGEPHDSALGRLATGHSVWFKWSAPTNTGERGHLLTLTTAGSDFDTFLFVGITNQIGGLDMVASNDNVHPQESYSRLSFEPSRGTTYFIAVDGVGRPGVGNYALNLDYSWVNIGVFNGRTLPKKPDNTIPAETLVRVNHWGIWPVGELRVRVVGRSTNSNSRIHLLSAEQDLDLLWDADGNPGMRVPFFHPPGESAQPGEGVELPLSYTIPALIPATSNDPAVRWGVFAILEEYVASKWVHIDTAFLGYGEQPPEEDGGLNWGLGGYPRPTAMQPGLTFDRAWIDAPALATDNSTAEIRLFARFRDASGRHYFTNLFVTPDRPAADQVKWTLPVPYALAPNKYGETEILPIGPITRREALLISATPILGSKNLTRATHILELYRQAALREPSSISKSDQGLTLRQAAPRTTLLSVQTANALPLANPGAWKPLLTTNLGTNQTMSLNLQPTNPSTYYRVLSLE